MYEQAQVDDLVVLNAIKHTTGGKHALSIGGKVSTTHEHTD